MNLLADLTSREEIILKEVINHYIASGEPVSSRTLSKLNICPWSSATIRNVMADLVDYGYLQQPHKSAGRMPSDKGYRFFVEELICRGFSGINAKIPSELYGEEAGMENLLKNTPRLLSSMTHHIGVILAPHYGHVRLQSINFIPLEGDRVLSVLVARSGNVLNKVIECTETFSREELIRFSNYLTTEFGGLSLWQIRDRISALMKESVDGMDGLILGALKISGQLFSLFDERREDFHVHGIPEDPVAQKILRELELSGGPRSRLMTLLTQCIENDGPRVFIGSEAAFTAENACSLIATSYSFGMEGRGVMGVLGKKMMAYEQIIPVVEETARALNIKLSSSKEQSDDG